MSTPSFARARFSILTAALVLCVGCSGVVSHHARDAAVSQGAAAQGAVPESAVPRTAVPQVVVSEPAVDAAPAAGAPGAARKSPMLALNQMVTAQALLVSLLLAPLSKEGAEGPLARVDARPASAPTH